MVSIYDGPENVLAPRIDIDYDRCTTPMACRKCMEICPQAVFFTKEVRMLKNVENDINDPGAYKVRPVFRDKCVACDDCVKACPVNAITITLAREG